MIQVDYRTTKTLIRRESEYDRLKLNWRLTVGKWNIWCTGNKEIRKSRVYFKFKVHYYYLITCFKVCHLYNLKANLYQPILRFIAGECVSIKLSLTINPTLGFKMEKETKKYVSREWKRKWTRKKTMLVEIWVANLNVTIYKRIRNGA